MNEVELIEKFIALNVDEPESWAKSQLSEGINQLGRAKALTLLMSNLQKITEPNQIRYEAKQPPERDRPYGFYGYIISKMIRLGLSEIEVLYFIKCVQAELIYDITGKLDGLHEVDENVRGIKLCDVNEITGKIEFIEGLHEDMLQFDPDKLEMCPPDSLVNLLENDVEFIKLMESQTDKPKK